MGLEGIVAKRKDSVYRSGRSPDWLKMKNAGRHFRLIVPYAGHDAGRNGIAAADRRTPTRSIRKRKQCVDMALRWELIALSLLAGIGFGLALDRGDTIFVGVFGAACAMAIIGGMQRFP